MADQQANPFSAVLNDLAGVYQTIWSELVRAAHEPAHGWYLPVLGSVFAGRCSLRTVVLRAVDAERRTLIVHTDRRSAKVEQIQASPHVAWLFYDTDTRTQLRVESMATLHFDDACADEQWRNSRLESRRTYLGPYQPGAIVAEPTINLPPELRNRPPTSEEVQPGRRNFAVISAQVLSIEWLLLQQTGNLAARFELNPQGGIDSTWLTA